MNYYNLGAVAGFLVCIIFVYLLCKVLSKSGDIFQGFHESAFDERQQRARIKSFKYGFFTLLAYNALYALSSLVMPKWCDLPTGCFVGISISVGVFAVVSILNDAYFTLKENPKNIMRVFLMIMILNALPVIITIMDEDESIIEDGILTFRCINALMVLLFIVIMVTVRIKQSRDKKADGEQ